MTPPPATTEGSAIAAIEETLSLLARRASLPRVHKSLNASAGVSLGWYAYIALYWIDAAGPLRLTELADHFGVVPSTVCRHVQQLEREGLVSKTKDPVDGRAVRLTPTPQGKAVLEELSAARQSAIRTRLDGWSGAELDALADNLLRVRAAFDDFDSDLVTTED